MENGSTNAKYRDPPEYGVTVKKDPMDSPLLGGFPHHLVRAEKERAKKEQKRSQLWRGNPSSSEELQRRVPYNPKTPEEFREEYRNKMKNNAAFGHPSARLAENVAPEDLRRYLIDSAIAQKEGRKTPPPADPMSLEGPVVPLVTPHPEVPKRAPAIERFVSSIFGEGYGSTAGRKK
jgi:hypothetical protein